MTLKLKVLLRVVKRRVDAGETLEAVLADYPKLTEAEREKIMAMLADNKQ